MTRRLGEIEGFGKAKLERYGADVLAVFGRAQSERDGQATRPAQAAADEARDGETETEEPSDAVDRQ